jgi:hypothetical protein
MCFLVRGGLENNLQNCLFSFFHLPFLFSSGFRKFNCLKDLLALLPCPGIYISFWHALEETLIVLASHYEGLEVLPEHQAFIMVNVCKSMAKPLTLSYYCGRWFANMYTFKSEPFIWFCSPMWNCLFFPPPDPVGCSKLPWILNNSLKLFLSCKTIWSGHRYSMLDIYTQIFCIAVTCCCWFICMGACMIYSVVLILI